MTTALKVSGCPPDAKFAFVNDTYEPMQTQHNGRPAYVARGVASRYLFHTGKGRWVISKVLDDGYKCWAFVKAVDDVSPASCTEPWQMAGVDGHWQPESRISCSSVPASNDKFVQLRMSLDAEMKKYGLIEVSDLKKLWRALDYNGNNIVSLAEIDKLVSEHCGSGAWPEWLNNKPALMRAYKKTCLKDGNGDDWVQKSEFHDLLLNIFWFNKLFAIFQQVDSGADRRIDVREFQSGMNALGLNMSPQEAQADFQNIDGNGGGQVLFVEFCAYVRKRVNPDANPNFDVDILEGEDCTKAHYFSAQQSAGGGAARGLNVGGGFETTILPHKGGGGKRNRTETLRSCGNQATCLHHVKGKTFADFDSLEVKIKAMLNNHSQIRAMWRVLDFNGNNIVSLAEIDKWAVEQYPLLNHKPALMRCYKATIASGAANDGWVHKKDFKSLVANMFYFNKLYWLFDEANGDDRRMDFTEFQRALVICGVKMNQVQARQSFQEVDKNGGGMVLFDEFCHYVAHKSCPEGMTAFIDDEADRPTGADGTAAVLGYASGHVTGVWGR